MRFPQSVDFSALCRPNHKLPCKTVVSKIETKFYEAWYTFSFLYETYFNIYY